MKNFIIAVDFDGTIVEHEFPEIGRPVPGALEWLRRFQEAGAKLILWTMRSDGQDAGDVLSDALRYLESNGVKLWGVNDNPGQEVWTNSPKAYAHAYIDDAAVGCPLMESKRMGGRPMVDWEKVGPLVLALMKPDSKK